MRILDVEEVAFLQVVEKLDQLRCILEVHFLVVEDLLYLLVFTTFYQFLEVLLEVFNRNAGFFGDSARRHRPLVLQSLLHLRHLLSFLCLLFVYPLLGRQLIQEIFVS